MIHSFKWIQVIRLELLPWTGNAPLGTKSTHKSYSVQPWNVAILPNMEEFCGKGCTSRLLIPLESQIDFNNVGVVR